MRMLDELLAINDRARKDIFNLGKNEFKAIYVA